MIKSRDPSWGDDPGAKCGQKCLNKEEAGRDLTQKREFDGPVSAERGV